MSSEWHIRYEATRYLQNCVEMLRDRMAVTLAALNQSPLPDGSAAAAAAASTSGSASGTAVAMPEEHALADVAFERAVAGSLSAGIKRASQSREGEMASRSREGEMASRTALLEALLRAGQEPEEAAAVFECLAQRGNRREMVTRRQWRAAVAVAAARGTGAVTGAFTGAVAVAAAVNEGGGDEGGAGGSGGCDVSGGGGGGSGAVVGDGVDTRSGGRRQPPYRLSIEGVDTLLLYIGCSLYAQQLLMKREVNEVC